nr:MAG TPA: hypothetical protein [Caudoviricetes sp.]
MLQISVLFMWIPPCHSVIAVMALWQRQKVFPSALSRPDRAHGYRSMLSSRTRPAVTVPFV